MRLESGGDEKRDELVDGREGERISMQHSN